VGNRDRAVLFESGLTGHKSAAYYASPMDLKATIAPFISVGSFFPQRRTGEIRGIRQHMQPHVT